MKLIDGRVVNLDKVALVEPFNAAAAATESYLYQVDAKAKARYLAENENRHARLFLTDTYNPEAGGANRLGAWQLIDEYPEEFMDKANDLIVVMRRG